MNEVLTASNSKALGLYFSPMTNGYSIHFKNYLVYAVAATKKCEICTKHLICTHRISKFTISWIPAEQSVTRLVEKITESMSTQKVGTFDNCCNAGCSKVKLIVVWHKTDYLRCSQFFWWKQWYFDQMHETFISQGTVVTFSDVVDRNKTFCKSSSGFRVWKIMPISWFLRGV